MKIMTVVGARPNFMKVAPIIRAVRDARNLGTGRRRTESDCSVAPRRIKHVLVHTGQHYGALMSRTFIRDLELPEPDFDLCVGSASHAGQTAEIMKRFEPVLVREKPDVLLVAGDVNSTLACALVAAKISSDAFGRRPLIGHVEAGLRSFDLRMPEEINRVLIDRLSDILFVTEASGLRNLAAEGIAREKVHFVGNTMIDSLLAYEKKAESSSILGKLGLQTRRATDGAPHFPLPYGLLTLHRPANVDRREEFVRILEGVGEITRRFPVIFPAHPRTRRQITNFGLRRYFASDAAESEHTAIRLTQPLGYLDFLCLMKHALVVVTDSGGIQEETTFLGVPCVTVRENTERPVTVELGTNIVAGASKEGIAAAVRLQLERKRMHSMPAKWDGQAAKRIVQILLSACRELPLRNSHRGQCCDSRGAASDFSLRRELDAKRSQN